MRVLDYLNKAVTDAGVQTGLIESAYDDNRIRLCIGVRDRFQFPVFTVYSECLRRLEKPALRMPADSAVKRLISRILSAVELRRRGWRTVIYEQAEHEDGFRWQLCVFDESTCNRARLTLTLNDAQPDPTTDEIEAALLGLGLKDACLGREGEKT